METSEVRRRLLETMDRARREAAARRTRAREAEDAWDRLLPNVVAPIGRQIVSALRAEGYPFTLSLPAGRLRIGSDRSAQDFIELTLDTDRDPPAVTGLVSRERGRHVLTRERSVREGTPVGELDEQDILQFLLAEIVPFVER